MMETTFHPPPAWIPRIAPTELEQGKPLRGVVHDETARAWAELPVTPDCSPPPTISRALRR